MITRRALGDDALLIVASVGGTAGEYRFDGEYTDIITGSVYKGALKLEPYEVRVLRRA